eukprot:TRINITY_DN7345_c0_g1_i1.p1 TRINITY_DN7345_c0_g1~~TRINITY_DN7345_c0_g1_i1.p1  ORF type:complete len:263 (-),score=40.29 TRINITY_DN7345_c0_g1_i1:39-803(-)
MESPYGELSSSSKSTPLDKKIEEFRKANNNWIRKQVEVVGSSFTIEDFQVTDEDDDDSKPEESLSARVRDNAINALNKRIQQNIESKLTDKTISEFTNLLKERTLRQDVSNLRDSYDHMTPARFPKKWPEKDIRKTDLDLYTNKRNQYEQLYKKLQAKKVRLRGFEAINGMLDVVDVKEVTQSTITDKSSALVKEIQDTNRLLTKIQQKLKRRPDIVAVIRSKKHKGSDRVETPNDILLQYFESDAPMGRISDK